ncbi:MAG TPA: hypothetical protein VN893_23885 [Bryobacteraceae bacterium]|nr:hypothetical protein [Bryobacteraceae bacterium]
MSFRLSVAPAVLLAAAAMSVYAQSPAALRVSVPFQFSINNTAMPAGDYSISRAGFGRLLALRSSDNRHTILFAGNAAMLASAPQQSSVVFNHDDNNNYALAAIWFAGYTSGVKLGAHEFPMTASQHSPEVIVLASR